MTHYALAEFEGDGTDDAPFRPAGCDRAERWSMIDLRPDCTVADGLCLIASSEPFPVKAVTRLGDDLDTAPGIRLRKRIANRLGLNLARFDLRGMTVDLLIEHARTDGTRWKPVRAGRDGWLQIWLGGLIWQTRLVRGGATYTDSFPGATSGTDLGTTTQSTHDWTLVFGASGGLTQNGSGAVRNSGVTNSCMYRAEVAAASVDQYCEIDVATFTWPSATLNLMPLVRCPTGTGTGALDGYGLLVLKTAASTGQRLLQKRIDGAGTTLASDATHPAAPFTAKVTASGSSISGYWGGALILGPITDTVVTTGNYGAIFSVNQGAADLTVITEWRFGDLAAAPTSVAYVGAIPILS